MNDELHNYIRQARDDGADHQAIQSRLVNAGWHPNTVTTAIEKHQTSAPANESPTENSPLLTSNGMQKEPVGVVKMYSTRGVEYYLMLITLATSAVTFGVLLLSISEQLFGQSNMINAGVMAFTTSALVVSLPIFAFLFLRLKKAEIANPRLRFDPSRRRMVQIALITSFVVGIISLIGFLYTLLLSVYGGGDYELGDMDVLIANMIITLGIAAGIFTYFWADSHRKGEQ